jgi:AcrR family transcriptional regulator
MPRTEEQFQQIRDTTRNLILSNALELFAEQGYKGTSITDIAKKAKVSKGLLYNYFSSKQELMEKVVGILLVEIESTMKVLNTTKDPFEKIQQLIDVMFDMMLENEKFWKLYSSFLMQPDVQEVAGKIFGNLFPEMFKEIENVFRKAKIKNAAKEAKLLGAILDGLGFHIMLMGKEYPIKAMRKFLKEKYSKTNLI